MTTSRIVVQPADSTDMTNLPAVPQMAGVEQPIQIPGLGDLEQSFPQHLDESDYGCHDLTQPALNEPQDSSSTSEPASQVPSTQEAIQEPQTSPEIAEAEQAADDEWQRQHMAFHNDKTIHHFNLLGHGMPCKNATPPAVSLFVAMTGAKTGFIREKIPDAPHNFALMRNAMRHVDPVIYYGNAEDLWLRGESLREAVTGACEKYYSEHGTWQDDSYNEEEDRPSLDEMYVRGYPVSSLPVNGWYQHPLVWDRAGLATRSYELAAWQTQLLRQNLYHMHRCERKGSLLRHMTTAEQPESQQKDTSEKPKAVVPSKGKETPAKLDSAWTVDLEKYFGKCKQWSDDLDDEDEEDEAVGEESSASSQSGSPSATTQTSAVDESETYTEVDSTSEAAVPEPLPESTVIEKKNFVGKDNEMDKLSSAAPLLQTGAVHGAAILGHDTLNSLVQAVEGLTDEELQSEDEEIYGDSTASSDEVSALLQRLRDSGLISRDDGAPSASQNSENEDDRKDLAPTSHLEPITLGSSFSLPIRGKPHTPFDQNQLVSGKAFDITSPVASSTSFSLPIRVKLPGSFNVANHGASKPNKGAQSHNQEAVPVTADESIDELYTDPPLQPDQGAVYDSEDEDEVDANEQMSPIPSETLDTIILPLRPRRAHDRRLTDSPSDLLDIVSETWSEADASGHIQDPPSSRSLKQCRVLPTETFESAIVSPKQMLEKFKSASVTPNKRASLPRSHSFSDLKSLAARCEPLQTTHRQSSLPSRAELEKLAMVPLPKPRAQSKVDKLESIAEEDDGTDDTDHVDDSTPPEVPVRSPRRLLTSTIPAEMSPEMPIRSTYKRPASNTPRKMMGRSIQFGLPDSPDSTDSTVDTDLLDEIDSSSMTVEGTGDRAFYALNNWNGIFGHDNNAAVPRPVTLVDTDDVRILGDSPKAESSTATGSEGNSGQGSPGGSTDETGATTPLESPKTVKDVRFVQTRPPKSTWGKLKEKLTVRPSASLPKLPEAKKAKLGKSVKKFLRKGIESFAVMNQGGF